MKKLNEVAIFESFRIQPSKNEKIEVERLKKQFKRSYITNDYFNEMHGEDIEVPFISNTNLNEKINNENHLYDTISVSKKIFSTLNINLETTAGTLVVKVYHQATPLHFHALDSALLLAPWRFLLH